ncbi:hypothetical protein Sru01_45970 [Sphaerisporangium rufum]|uniref:DUF397 domain-containing protein n=1 Tax=Sphaerisporangium rufum TaxID=1381558 RepID=A0A919R7E8_9ACTN|nr:DUF397 domain-containing protein [Sphaerisporangium rufum]GII79615.1 hypothetical protein Sru01_45970 [Sphaerisporangium rufum]
MDWTKLTWRKSIHSGTDDNCVEVAVASDGGRAVRDSKVRGVSAIQVSSDGWNAFINGLKHEALR